MELNQNMVLRTTLSIRRIVADDCCTASLKPRARAITFQKKKEKSKVIALFIVLYIDKARIKSFAKIESHIRQDSTTCFSQSESTNNIELASKTSACSKARSIYDQNKNRSRKWKQKKTENEYTDENEYEDEDEDEDEEKDEKKEDTRG
ncbi:LOW QUALITY PROTEIN: hypothetical protein V1477_010154 [Vespula maculifrons]|uniref:Uncharacterized protein n=1 Tax=Vespula maculifrons TaxID=7453 RepID=A0ABD2C9V8_VESMC